MPCWRCRPAAQRGQCFGADVVERAVVGRAQRIERGVARRASLGRRRQRRRQTLVAQRLQRQVQAMGALRGTATRVSARLARLAALRGDFREITHARGREPADRANEIRAARPRAALPSRRVQRPARRSPRSSRAHSDRNRRFTPGSLKRLAMVGNTGISASGSFDCDRDDCGATACARRAGRLRRRASRTC